MSVSVYVAARKMVSRDERSILDAYNACVANGIVVSDSHKRRIVEILGEEPKWWDEPLDLDYKEWVEIRVRGEGDVMYDDGMVLNLEDLPKGTKELRIFAEA